MTTYPAKDVVGASVNPPRHRANGHSATSIEATDLVMNLTEACGAQYVTTPAGPVRDWWPLALKASPGSSPGVPWLALVAPGSIEEVARVLQVSQATTTPVIPVGGLSGVVGAAIPLRPSIGIDTRRFDQIDIDTDNSLVHVGAGVLGGRLEKILNEAGFTSGLYPQALNIASIGGMVATRAIGTYSGLYGGMENLLVGLDAVLNDGTIVSTERLTRWSIGPDVRMLFLGAEGSLGVVTSVTMRIARLPERRLLTAWIVADLDRGLGTLHSIVGRGLHPATLRLYDAPESAAHWPDLTLGEGECVLIVAIDGPNEVAEAIQREVASVITDAGGRSELGDLAQVWDRNRLNIPSGFTDLRQPGVMVDYIDVQAPWSHLRGTYDAVHAALSEHCTTVAAHFSHIYAQGSSCYFVVRIDAEGDTEALTRYHAAWAGAMDAALRAGGTIAHHHGIGHARGGWAPQALHAAAALHERVARAFDPDGTLGADRFIRPVSDQTGADS